MNPVILWFRNDLRLHDHAALQAAWQAAIAANAPVIPLYCFDPRHFRTTAWGFAKTGGFRAQFLHESVADLRRSLQVLGADLLVRVGQPEDVIPALATQIHAQAVHYHGEATPEELGVEAAVGDRLTSSGVKLHRHWGSTLYQPEDLPFAIADLPELFTRFRQAVEREGAPRSPLPSPTSWVDWRRSHPNLDPGELPSLDALGVDPPPSDPRRMIVLTGGETAGRSRLDHYIWHQDALRRYKETRNGMLRADDSSKFSPWLAHGCLSPRAIAAEVARYETERVRNDSTYWLIFELLWRDYFRFIALKHGNALFLPAGLQGVPIPWKQDWPRFELWREGRTGFPLVDANLRELAATGFMSNRGRQNVASFLTKNLGIDWRMGAAWFESQLMDYDPCSNWGNWNYTAGVGNDARGFRFFNILKQSKDYDPDGAYVKHWLPELTRLPRRVIHTPWKLSREEQTRYGVQLGVNYPQPMVDLFASAAANEQIYRAAVRG